jgi:hypothetical protein
MAAGILDGSGRTPGIWPNPSVLAENWPSRPAFGQLAGIWPFDLPAKWPVSGNFRWNLYLANIKKIFLY